MSANPIEARSVSTSRMRWSRRRTTTPAGAAARTRCRRTCLPGTPRCRCAASASGPGRPTRSRSTRGRPPASARPSRTCRGCRRALPRARGSEGRSSRPGDRRPTRPTRTSRRRTRRGRPTGRHTRLPGGRAYALAGRLSGNGARCLPAAGGGSRGGGTGSPEPRRSRRRRPVWDSRTQLPSPGARCPRRSTRPTHSGRAGTSRASEPPVSATQTATPKKTPPQVATIFPPLANRRKSGRQ